MKKLAIIAGAAALLVALVALAASTAMAGPGWATTIDGCGNCHVNGTDGAIAVTLFGAAHGGVVTTTGTPPAGNVSGNWVVGAVVGDCMTCHEPYFEPIHGSWAELTEACARCHRTHTAAADDLLVMDKNDLCEFCHGSSNTLALTNVMDGVMRTGVGGTTLFGGSLRGGGFDNAIMNHNDHADVDNVTGDWVEDGDGDIWDFPNSVAVSEATTSSHSLGVADALIWGSGDISAAPVAGTTTTTLECVSCHDPHQFGDTYRMLKPQPTDSAIGGHGSTEYAFVTDILAAGNLPYTIDDYTEVEGYAPDVLDGAGNPVYTAAVNAFTGAWNKVTIDPLGDTDPLVPGSDADDYEQAVVYPKYSQQITVWCSSCHERYHSEKSGYNGAGSVSSGDAIFNYRHKTGDEVHLVTDLENTAVGDGGSEPDDQTTLAGVIDLFTGTASNSCGYNGANCHGTAFNFNKMLTCLGCHVSHGTSAAMQEYAGSVPWPGEDGIPTGTPATNYDGLPGTPVDPALVLGAWADSSRSSLLRLDGRAVCQNFDCHPKNAAYADVPDHFMSDFVQGGDAGLWHSSH